MNFLLLSLKNTKTRKVGTIFSTAPDFVCGGDIYTNGTSVVFTSDNYPWHYRSRSDCLWTLHAEEGFHVLVNFSVISLERCCDFIEV